MSLIRRALLVSVILVAVGVVAWALVYVSSGKLKKLNPYQAVPNNASIILSFKDIMRKALYSQI